MLKRVSLEAFAMRCALEAKSNRLTVLAGAGISMLPPSQLPSGYDLKRMAIEDLSQASALRRVGSKILSAPGFATVVPEVIFQRFHECFGDRLLPFFDVLSGVQHNVAHDLLARLADTFATPILTTNFDGLIEACRRSTSPVLHLHGELADPKQMVIRLHQIGKGLPAGATRRAGRRIAGRVVCVLGYSGNDEDVRLLLRDYPPAEVLWLVRNAGDYALQNIHRFFGTFNVSISQGSLEHLTKRIAQASGWKLPPTRRCISATPAPRTWHHCLTERDRYAALAEALLEIRQYTACAELANIGAARCPVNEKPSWFHVQAATALRMCADTPKAMKHAERAVLVARQYGDHWDRAAALNALGLVHLERARSNPKLARVYLRRAVKALQQKRRAHWPERISGLAARIYNNLGLVEMQLEAELPARAMFARSLRLKRRIGDLPGEGTTAANMAILNSQHGRYSTASRWRKRAFLLIDRYHQKYRAAYLHRRLGVALCAQGSTTRGLLDLNEALRLYREIGIDSLGTRLTLAAIAKYRV